MMDYVQNCKKSLRELVPGPESELQNVRLRTSDGVELVAIATNECHTFFFIAFHFPRIPHNSWKYFRGAVLSITQ